jgi:hypothetical protein
MVRDVRVERVGPLQVAGGSSPLRAAVMLRFMLVWPGLAIVRLLGLRGCAGGARARGGVEHRARDDRRGDDALRRTVGAELMRAYGSPRTDRWRARLQVAAVPPLLCTVIVVARRAPLAR